MSAPISMGDPATLPPGRGASLASEVAELVADCAEVLACPGYEAGNLATHLTKLRETLRSNAFPPDVAALMEAATLEFEALDADPALVFDGDENRRLALSDALQTASERLGLPRYLFHGTVAMRLPGILHRGLVPGAFPVWRTPELASRCAEAVFFSVRWREAADFALVAHSHTRGPRDGPGRRPVVLRLPAAGLNVEVDRLRSSGASRMVKGCVPAAAADVFLPPLRGLPRWRRLSDIVGRAGP